MEAVVETFELFIYRFVEHVIYIQVYKLLSGMQ